MASNPTRFSKYSLREYLPWEENPDCNVEILRERHAYTYAEHSEKIKLSLERALQRIETTRDNDRTPDSQQKIQPKPTIDAMFCIGSGQISWDRQIYGIWDRMRQLVFYECFREVLAQHYDIPGPSYIQDPCFNELDKAFLTERGLTVTVTAERDMTSDSCLFALPMMPHIPSGMVADYQPRVYQGTFSPTRTEPMSRDYKAHQKFMETHASEMVRDRTQLKQDHALWVRKE